jgi:hypothetical protein
MPDFNVERLIGRLVHVRVYSLASKDAVRAYERGFERFRDRDVGSVVCADHRRVKVYPPDVADELIALFTSLNDVWERAVILTSPAHAVLTMQLQRIVAQSENPSRRIFADTRGARDFLREVLDDKERAALDVFLAS